MALRLSSELKDSAQQLHIRKNPLQGGPRRQHSFSTGSTISSEEVTARIRHIWILRPFSVGYAWRNRHRETFKPTKSGHKYHDITVRLKTTSGFLPDDWEM
ncbi:hypothetical protein PISMIDRAFT_682019 [Pisolithus microcarpus 441]|uniref:Uncharacterized protein n=1 Tax=Pisolithus microcarpus 441 TaxID=765257 RepID=A0A0C9Z0E2_9AGAM|nr:hypothetical protein PISMIDRAFT_688649 [Pisolithus microcarpus 441]KIK20818.1 hypothetical protein PISMIDRAFT_682019 [Pisolithus microcarpus 441]